MPSTSASRVVLPTLLPSTDQEKNRAAALRIGCLVLFNALAFQDRLSAANDNVPMVEEALQKGIPGLRAAWLAICNDIDYVPVFELAAELLAVLEDGPEGRAATGDRSVSQGRR